MANNLLFAENSSISGGGCLGHVSSPASLCADRRRGGKALMTRIAVFVISLVCFASTCEAQMRLNQFTCAGSLDDLEGFELAKGRVRINNFILAEDKSWVAKEVMVLNFSASGTNRGEGPAYVTLEAVGFDPSGALLFAITAQPMMSIISPGKAEQIHGDIYVAPGLVEKASKICVRVSGEW